MEPNNNTFTFNFTTWDDFVRTSNYGESLIPISNRESRSTYSNEFFGTTTFEEAINLALNGWPEGADKIMKGLEITLNDIPSYGYTREVVRQVRGPGVLDFHRYSIGHPQAMISWNKKYVSIQSGKIVRILVNIGARSIVSPSTIIQQGVYICSLIDHLESLGRRVELDIVSLASDKERKARILVQVKVKKAQDPLDINRIAFAVAHPSCLRRLIFSLREQTPATFLRTLNIRSGGGYGFSLSYKETGPIVLGYLSCDEDFSMERIKGQLAQQGIEVLI